MNEEIEYLKKYLDKDKLEEGLKRLKNGEPVQYIVGNVDFYGYQIDINKDVLIPRFETEYLIEKTLNYINKLGINNPNILDIGTGSGCISIVLKKEINCEVDAIDISNKALNVAMENAKNNNVNINFQNIDIHDFSSSKKYDVIISNPPYVPFASEVDERIKYEPENAIYAKDNGIYFYKIILEKIVNNLNDNYLIAFEIGDKEGNQISEIIRKNLPNAYFIIEKDYNNYERYIFISNINLFN